MKIKITSSQMEQIEGLTPEYPYTLHRINLDDTVIPWHWHQELEFIYVLEGNVKLKTSARSYSFGENEAFFMNTNTLCALENINHCRLESHLFDKTFLGGHFRSIFETKYLNPVLQNNKIDVVIIRGETENQKRMLKKLQQLGVLQNKTDVEFQTRSILSEIWLLLLEEIKNMDEQDVMANTQNQERLMTMLSFIHENYSKKLNLAEIAQSASVSKRECLRCFQNGIHESPFDYLIGYRIECAKKLLRSTDMPITEIALETGFSNNAYFSKIFRRECGETPRKYRDYH
ncbi:MAG: AraC family transcriptional regulator [Blautia sp.]|nr:AraC family transcriptional regulator [Blautia sp.]